MQLRLSYFKQIAAIPRASGNEQTMREFLLQWALVRNYRSAQDAKGNIVLYIPATWGKELHPPVILQAHMDMVCVKEPESIHDFARDPIVLVEEDGRLQADRTTLGADNGIGIALMLTAARFEQHPPLELLFTVEEEIGLYGAQELDASLLTGKKLINLDSELLGEICISSAGGARVELTIPCSPIQICGAVYTITVSWLLWGHSGVDIHKKRGNALQILARCIHDLLQEELVQLIDFSGGQAMNAIPREACAVVTIESIHLSVVQWLLQWFLQRRQQDIDTPDVQITLSPCVEEYVYAYDMHHLVTRLAQQSLGVMSMSTVIPWMVETSINRGVAKTSWWNMELIYLPRSSDAIALDQQIVSLQQLANDLGGTGHVLWKYYGRQQDPNSSFLSKVHSIYERLLQKDVSITMIHAGLECGILAQKIGIEAEVISFGPTILDAHSPQERVDIASVDIIAKLLEHVLQEL
jgi:dipeptidase D